MQKEDRLKVARDLHDNIGSILVAAKMQFEVGIDSLKEQNKQLTKAYQLLEKALETTREISHNLHADELEKMNLLEALEKLRRNILVEGILEAKLIYDPLPKLTNNMTHQLYRCIQEVLTNVLKHAKATQITISLKTTPKNLTLTIKDNGIGFDPETVTPGLGTQNIKARVTSIDGNYQIRSQKGHSTCITIQIPLSYETNTNFISR